MSAMYPIDKTRYKHVPHACMSAAEHPGEAAELLCAEVAANVPQVCAMAFFAM
jgi:hypothetical protein